MKFYPHHISDFNNSTRHLTRVERSVYRDAIEHYYDTELPLITNLDKLSKRLLCFVDDEKNALIDILDEFFEISDDGYFHIRCDEEITKYRANIGAKARAGIASAEARRKKSEELRKKATGVKSRSTGVHNQEPITNNQEPIIKTLDQSSIDPELFEQFWRSGIRKVNKKKTLALFNNLLKKQTDAASFTEILILDVKARLNSNQLGFAEMHPTTYLNGERWEDAINHRLPALAERKTTFENLTDRSWADSIIPPKQIGVIYEA